MKSILNDILEDIKNEKDIKKIKQICFNRIKNSRVNKKDKGMMLHIISKKDDYFSLMKAVYDLILKYEGDGVINESLNGYKLKKGGSNGKSNLHRR